MTLTVEDLHTFAGEHHAVRGVSFSVGAGEVVALLGRNGSGKTTTIHSIVGLARPRAGAVRLRGTDVTGWPPHRVARCGVGFVAQGRPVFPSLTVEENLGVGDPTAATARILGRFPELAARRTQRAGTLSGGEQQMLALARCLARDPDLLVLDEPTAGLATHVLERSRHLIVEARARGAAILLAEQHLAFALSLADRVVVLERGRIAVHGAPTEIGRSLDASHLRPGT